MFRSPTRIAFAAVLVIGAAAFGESPEVLAQNETAVAEGEGADHEVLTRGPVHEAFAEQVNNDPTGGPTATKVPPDSIDEIPPEYRPDGENVVWVPGYWAWDDDREDFIWVSGIWRDVPPGRSWVPGYWNESNQWIAGYWSEESVGQPELLDSPPQSLEQGPSSEAPSADHFWVPGCWLPAAAGYQWRPGYWHAYRENWIWVPAHYVWTPGGCIYVSGYWDHVISRRGQLFAPVYFRPHVHYAHGYRYSPSFVIDTTHLSLHLFLRPRYHHYYFGDYYDPHYAARDFCSYAHYHRSGRGYDPLFAYYNVHFHRHGIDYSARIGGWHRYFTNHKSHRPPRTYRHQADFAKRNKNNNHVKYAMLGRSARDATSAPGSAGRLRRLGAGQRSLYTAEAQRVRDQRGRRRRVEQAAAAGTIAGSSPIGNSPSLTSRAGRRPNVQASRPARSATARGSSNRRNPQGIDPGLYRGARRDVTALRPDNSESAAAPRRSATNRRTDRPSAANTTRDANAAADAARARLGRSGADRTGVARTRTERQPTRVPRESNREARSPSRASPRAPARSAAPSVRPRAARRVEPPRRAANPSTAIRRSRTAPTPRDASAPAPRPTNPGATKRSPVRPQTAPTRRQPARSRNVTERSDRTGSTNRIRSSGTAQRPGARNKRRVSSPPSYRQSRASRPTGASSPGRTQRAAAATVPRSNRNRGRVQATRPQPTPRAVRSSPSVRQSAPRSIPSARPNRNASNRASAPRTRQPQRNRGSRSRVKD